MNADQQAIAAAFERFLRRHQYATIGRGGYSPEWLAQQLAFLAVETLKPAGVAP